MNGKKREELEQFRSFANILARHIEEAPALLPCPFCGGSAQVVHDSGNEVFDQSWRAGCTLCGVQFMERGSNSWAPKAEIDEAAKARAIRNWNRRA